MTFISYAQNLEDVMLWRALKHIDKGFYIDAGAAWPDFDSVTKAFYMQGWRGINIEPNPKLYSQLMESRSRDINLRLAVSDVPGLLEMNFLGDSGLSTLDKDIAHKHEIEGWDVQKENVEVLTLAEVWKNHVPSGQDVHFLKIDVEGKETEVLRGSEWTCYRPWVVVVEATLPSSQEESHDEWENTLLSSEYVFAYADGLNRFYVASEHSELLSAFKYPPNVFDRFLLRAHQQAEEQARQADERIRLADERASQTMHMLNAVYNSKSWKITKPIRSFKSFIKRVLSLISRKL